MPAGRPTKYREEMCERVVEYGKQGMSLCEMCSNLGIWHDTFDRWRNDKPKFSAAVKEALRESQAWWERKGREATMGGVEGFNATSYIFQMKNRFRKDWRDKHEVAHDVSGEITVVIGGSVDED